MLQVQMADLDPASDPLNRPGSGIYVEAVDANNARLEVNMVGPKEVVREVLTILSRFAA